MHKQVDTLHETDWYSVLNYKLLETGRFRSPTLISQAFNICMVRHGYFDHYAYRRVDEVYTGRALVSKPDCEFQMACAQENVETSTILRFSPAFYLQLQQQYAESLGWFFGNPDQHCILLQLTPYADRLHQTLMHPHPSQLKLDELVLELLDAILGAAPADTNTLTPLLKRHHLHTVIQAKDYLLAHYATDISMAQLAEHCCVSLFHFCRLFKAVTHYSPYQYLLQLRLDSAHAMLRQTDTLVHEIALRCGFNSLEHFITTYRRRFGAPPQQHRHLLANSKILQRSQVA